MHNKPFRFNLCIEGELPMNKTATFTGHVSAATQGDLVFDPDGGALPDQTVGVAVSDIVTTVSGGRAPYSFDVSAGDVPAGCDLTSQVNDDGSETISIEGTPSQEEDFSFDLTVTDADGATATLRGRGNVRGNAPQQRRAKVRITRR